MKTLRLALVSIILGLVAPLAALADDVPSLAYGYCGEMAHSIGMYGKNVAYQGGICIDAETTSNYAGCTLKAVMIGAGTEAWKEAKINLSHDLAEAPFYQQDIEVATEQWNTIALTTPYELEAGRPLYIYYTLKAGQNARERWCPIATDDGPANSKGDFWGYGTTPEALTWRHLADEGYGNICIKAVLEGVMLTRYDLTVDAVTTRDFVKPGVPFSAEVAVRNVAAETITSLDLTAKVGSAAPVTKTFATNLANNSTAYFTLDNLVIDEEGDCPLTVTVSRPNGAEDEFADNDSRTVTIRCSARLVKRKVLLEIFSTAACVNCPAGHERLSEALGGDDDIIWVTHHAGYGSDAMTLQQSTTYLNLYNASGSYAPAMMLDRTCLYNEGASVSNSPVTKVDNATTIRHLADVRLDEPAVLTINAEARIEDGRVIVDVSGESVTDLEGARINVFLTEDGIIGPQSGAANELVYVHNHVLRDVMTTTWGNSFELNDGRFHESFSTYINDAWHLDKMHVVAFVSHMNFSDPCDCAVYNATSLPLATAAEGIGTVVSDTRDDAPCYNLAGQRIGNPRHGGIYIQNGVRVKL